MKIVTRAIPGSAEWLAARRGRITASRAANIIGGDLGSHVYKSPLEEWHELRAELNGEVKAAEVEDDSDDFRTRAMAWGLQSEGLHRALLTTKLGEPVEEYACTVQDDEYEWLRANLDARTPSGLVVEMKAPTGFGMAKWEQGTPLAYQVQLAVQMRIVGAEAGIVSALVPPDVRYERFERAQATEDFVIGKLAAFWDSVVRDVPPEPTGADFEVVRRFAKADSGKSCSLPDELLIERAEILTLEEEIDAREQKLKGLKARVIARMGDASVGVFSNRSGYTLKSQTRQIKATEAKTIVTAPILRFSKSVL